MMTRIMLVVGIAALLATPADARHRHGHHRAHPGHARPACPLGTTYDNDGRIHYCGAGSPGFAPSPLEGRGGVRHQAHVPRRAARNNESGVSWRGGYARVCVAGHCGTVDARLADKFRGLFADFIAMGYNIGSPGCLSSGHMRHSLHHWGGACDLFDQVARNRTARHQPPASVQIEVAARHGLTSGCAWRSPDCGHFDVSGIGRSRRYAKNF